ncbi:Rieske 2Fe-2S domain-containing protein [Streptomyces sp. NPDC047028]|uniref:Rieske 2Fe-2S domain-containing protein n=1 Tax=Streptomyces sp. NPDC047028 TaxID=3155793 RepID=UPI0033CCFF79
MPKAIEDIIEGVENLNALDGLCDTAAGWVARATSRDAVKNALSGTWLSHPLHPVLTDLPIGAWVMASALDLTAGGSGAASARRLVGLGLVATVPAAVAGAADWSDTYGGTRRVGLVHALGNVVATTLQAASWAARRRGRHRAGAALGCAGLGLTVCAAYLGGHLSYVRGVGVDHTAFQETVTDWTEVAALSALTDGVPLRVTAGGVPVMLVRHAGELYALSATCTHAGGPLDEGAVLDDGCVRCPWHGSVFRLADGAAVRGPATVDEPRWDVRTDGDRVYVRSAR